MLTCHRPGSRVHEAKSTGLQRINFDNANYFEIPHGNLHSESVYNKIARYPPFNPSIHDNNKRPSYFRRIHFPCCASGDFKHRRSVQLHHGDSPLSSPLFSQPRQFFGPEHHQEYMIIVASPQAPHSSAHKGPYTRPGVCYRLRPGFK